MKNISFFSILIALALTVSLYAGDCKTAGSTAVNMKISGMTCDNCVQKVKTSLEKVDGVTGVDVTLTGNTAAVTFDPNKTSTEKLQAAVQATGFKVEATPANTATTCCEGKCASCTTDCKCTTECKCAEGCTCCAAQKATKI
ncbi:MAG TPA: heavy-metal-associated domain-containing protein [bacterium]|nr:heavy-metal-associated domain-containing protein [bacterium]HPN45926.1 heavy-metal-associated domain-containing protein [bacterium]